MLRSGRACDRGEGSGADRRAKRPAGQPRASSLAAFEPSLHFVDVIHALDDDAAGRGGEFVLEGAEAGADVDAPLMALSMVCGSMSCSVVASVGSGGASLRDAIRRPLPASLFLPSARDARPALIAIGSCDRGRPAAATEPAASMSLVRRRCGAGSSASRPRIAPRRAGRWRRWRRPGRGRLRVRRSSRAGDPLPHVAVWVDGPGSAGAVEQLRHAGATPALEGPAAADTQVHAVGPTRHPSLSGTPRLRTPCRAVATAGTPARGRIRAHSPAHPCVRTVEPLTSLVFSGFSASPEPLTPELPSTVRESRKCLVSRHVNGSTVRKPSPSQR